MEYFLVHDIIFSSQVNCSYCGSARTDRYHHKDSDQTNSAGNVDPVIKPAMLVRAFPNLLYHTYKKPQVHFVPGSHFRVPTDVISRVSTSCPVREYTTLIS